MRERIESLMSKARTLNSPYRDEEATNAQISDLAALVEETLKLLREEVATREALEARLQGQG